MSTLVGTQDCFKTAISELLELEYDAIEAYKAAIERLDNQLYRTQLDDFKADHDRHVRELTTLFEINSKEAPQGPSPKHWLTKGKVVLANLIGDDAILSAMLSNEGDTNQAYERMVKHSNKWPTALEVLQRGLEDERRHKLWIEQTLANK